MKSKSTQQTQNTYGWQTPPQTAAQSLLNTHLMTAFDTPDPTIPYIFSNQRGQLRNRFDNPFGFNYSPEVRDANMYARNEEIGQKEGQAFREDRFNRNNAKTSALLSNASLNAPVLTQTGGSMQGTQTSAIGPALIGLAGSIGGAALG